MDAIDGVLSAHSIGDTIEHWADNILRHKHQHHLQNCRLVSIEHRKNEDGPKHEYILVTVNCSADVRYIRIDRSFQRNPRDVQNHYRSLLRGRGVPADDTIIITSTPHHAGSFSLYAMYFDFAAAPTVYDLAIVLQAISSSSTSYSLESMCYWYARMVFDGIAVPFNGRVEPGQKPHLRGKFTRFIQLVDEGETLAFRAGLPWISNVFDVPTRLELLGKIADLRQEQGREGVRAKNVEIAEEVPLIPTLEFAGPKEDPKVRFACFFVPRFWLTSCKRPQMF